MALGVMRRTAATFIAGAILTSVVAAPHACADGVPQGWDRNDYIAYLAISDMIKAEFNEPWLRTACVSVAKDDVTRLNSEPSPEVLKALTSDLADVGLWFHPASDCVDARDGVKERSNQRKAIFVYFYPLNSSDSSGLARIGCTAEYAAGWHSAGMWGNGYFYRVVDGADRVSILRSSCVSAE